MALAATVDDAVRAVAFGAFANSGQICMPTERIVVDQRIADEFVQRLADKARSLPLGDPRLGPVVLGAVADQRAVERCNRLIDDALGKGAVLLCGGRASDTLVQATLVDHVTPDMLIYSEESFGPVKGIVRVDGDAAAVACANDNEYGLSSAIFSRDTARAAPCASQRVRYLPHQRRHRARRAAHAVWRNQGQRHRPLWRRGRD